jgi:hypothetical protein
VAISSLVISSILIIVRIRALCGPMPVSRRERAQELFKRANLLTLAAKMSSEGLFAGLGHARPKVWRFAF